MDDFDGMDEMDLDDMDLDDDDDDDDARQRRRSAGARLYTLFPKRIFDFTWLGPGATTTVVIKRALKLSPFYYYWFGMRIHNRDIQLSASSFTLQFFNTLPSDQDPREFTASTASTSLTCTSVPPDLPPALKLTTDSNLGPYLKVVMSMSQGSGTPPLRLYAELSGVLLARPA